MTTGSLTYRKHEADIWNGRIPDKYLRLLPHITGRRILELGAAEGVLSLLLADRDPSAQVIGLEVNQERHVAALALQDRWRALGRRVDGCTMVCGDIRDRLDLLAGVETLVAIRMIYYLRDTVPAVFAAIGDAVPNVVLAGNPNRAHWPHSSRGAADLGAFNLLAGVPGMREVLETAGYTIGTVVPEGDPIVTGHR